MLTLCKFLISGGSTRDIDAAKTSNTSPDDEDSEIGGKKQRKITFIMWAGVEAETEGRIPKGIDDLKVYYIKSCCNSGTLQGGRTWKKYCPTDWKDHGRTRYADCSGSYKFTKERCHFKGQYGVINTTQFEKKGCVNVVEWTLVFASDPMTRLC